MLVQSVSQEDILESDMATYSSILPWKIPWTEKQACWGQKESDTTEHAHTHTYFYFSPNIVILIHSQDKWQNHWNKR